MQPPRGARPTRRPYAVAVLLATALIVLSACSGSSDTPDTTTPVEPGDQSSDTFAPDEARDALAEGGISPELTDCAQLRLDPVAPIDDATIERLQAQCEGVTQFATALADNIGDLTDDQRTCLTDKLLALPPGAITNLYANAFTPNRLDVPDETVTDDAISRVFTDCEINPNDEPG